MFVVRYKTKFDEEKRRSRYYDRNEKCTVFGAQQCVLR